jgi:predicted thioesterase
MTKDPCDPFFTFKGFFNFLSSHLTQIHPYVYLHTGEGLNMGRLESGTAGRFSVKVSKTHLASFMGNIGVEVLSTPTLAWMFECAATDALAPVMEEGEISVGTWISVKHLKPTPPGMSVTATVTLREVKGIRYLFEVQVHDEVEKVAEGHIERAIIDSDRFYRSLREKEKGGGTGEK